MTARCGDVCCNRTTQLGKKAQCSEGLPLILARDYAESHGRTFETECQISCSLGISNSEARESESLWNSMGWVPGSPKCFLVVYLVPKVLPLCAKCLADSTGNLHFVDRAHPLDYRPQVWNQPVGLHVWEDILAKQKKGLNINKCHLYK